MYFPGPPLLQQVGRSTGSEPQLAPRSAVLSSQHQAGFYQLEPQRTADILRGQHFAPRQQQGSYYRLESELQPPSRNQIVPFFQQPDGVLRQPSNQLAMKPSNQYYYS